MKSRIMTIKKHPKLILHPLRNINRKLNFKIYSKLSPATVGVMSEDWDNLIILDSLRMDYFEKLCEFDGDMDSIYSRGSNSREFVMNNFQNNKHHDTVVVTSNSHYHKDLDKTDDTFHYIESYYSMKDSKDIPEDSVKSRDIRTEEQVDLTIELSNRFPNKRLITHIMPPHVPYFCDEAVALRKQIYEKDDIAFYFEHREEYEKRKNSDEYEWWSYAVDLHHACRLGLIDGDDMPQYYKKDLKQTLKRIKPLIDELDGKTVITGDHGEFLGERLPPFLLKEWTHPESVYSNVVREVPWFVLPYENRRKITTGSSVEGREVDQAEIEENLESLGYL